MDQQPPLPSGGVAPQWTPPQQTPPYTPPRPTPTTTTVQVTETPGSSGGNGTVNLDLDLKKATLSNTEINYVKLARTHGLYIFYAAFLFFYMVIPGVQLWRNQTIVITNLPDDFYWLMGAMYGIYAGARTYEKYKGVLQ